MTQGNSKNRPTILGGTVKVSEEPGAAVYRATLPDEPEVEAIAAMTESLMPESAGVPPHFTQEAGVLFEEKTANYVLNLSELSTKRAKLSSDEMVTKRHVEEADRFLGSAPTKSLWVKVFGVMGATVFGTGLAQLLSMASADVYTGAGVWISMAMIVAGVVAAVYHILND